MITGGCCDYYGTIIVGTGIAGSVLAFELEKRCADYLKRRADYLICTDQSNPLANTSSLSYGHCRVPRREQIEETIKRSVECLGEAEDRAKFVYSRAEFVLDLFEKLDIDYERRSFGVIPSGKERGGKTILKAIQQQIPNIETNMELIDFAEDGNDFNVQFRKNGELVTMKSNTLVLATGGYGGTFGCTDNFRYGSYRIFDLVKKNGGEVVNVDCVFVHPFGYYGGRKILIGNETKGGDFVDSYGKPVFDEETRRAIANNNYHEIFPRILHQIETCRKRGLDVYFVYKNKKIEICPTVHYTAGGIKTDYLGRVIGCENLFAIGECRADGSRNGGRLPGYPFTSAIVDGKVLGDMLA